MIDVDLCRDSTLMMISAEVVERIVTRFSQAVGGGGDDGRTQSQRHDYVFAS